MDPTNNEQGIRELSTVHDQCHQEMAKKINRMAISEMQSLKRLQRDKKSIAQSMKYLPKDDYKVEKPDVLEKSDIIEAQNITLNALKLSNFKKKNASVTQLKKGLCEKRIQVMAKQNFKLFNKKLPLAREGAADVYQMIGMPGFTGKKLTFDR